MPQEAIVRIDYQDETFVEKTFDEFVISVVDPTFISARSRLLWNRLHSADEVVVSDLLRECRRRSGLDVGFDTITSGELDALDIPLSEKDKLSFLAGSPVWHRQGFFTENGVGEKQTSHFNRGFNAWLAVLTTLFRASLVQAFRNDDGRYTPPRRGRRLKLSEDVNAILARALGYNPDVVRGDPGCIVNALLREANGTVLEFETLARLTIESAAERGRCAIDQIYAVETISKSIDPETGNSVKKRVVKRHSRAHTSNGGPAAIYADLMAAIAVEAKQFERLRGAPLDPFALAGWHVHVLTVVRLAASAAMTLDKNRARAMVELRSLMRGYHILRGRPNPDAAMLAEEAAMRVRIEVCCQEFHDRRATALPSCNPRDASALIRVFDQLNTVAVAFYTGLDIRDFDSGIADACDPPSATLIESAVWAGRLQRERIAQMTPIVASAILSMVTEQGWDGDSDQSLRRCRDLIFSCLSENSWPILLDVARDVHESGQTRTMLFHLAIHGERLGEASLGDVDRQPALPSRSRLANLPQTDRPRDDYLRFDIRTGAMISVTRPTYVTGYLTALPPLYSEEWQGRWGPADAHLRDSVAPDQE